MSSGCEVNKTQNAFVLLLYSGTQVLQTYIYSLLVSDFFTLSLVQWKFPLALPNTISLSLHETPALSLLLWY